MLPLKWKIFRLVCYLHIAAVFSCLALVLIINGRFIFSGVTNFLEFLLIFSVLTVLLSNSFINTWLLERYYPDRWPGRALNIWHITLFIAFVIIICLFTIGCFAIFFDVMLGENKNVAINQRSIISMIVFGIITLTGLSICYFQVSLRKTIRRNYQREIDSFLNT